MKEAEIMFVSTTFLPKGKVSHVIVDKNAPEEFFENLKKLKIEAIPSFEMPELSGAVATHPDMQIYHLGGKEAVCARSAFFYYNRYLEPLGIKLSIGDSEMGSNYPNDIAYNVLRVGNRAFSKTSHTEPKIKSMLTKGNVRIIDVAQGYTKCAVCVVGENAVITADAGLERIFKECGIDTLKIDEGGIELKGMDYGFIGGCSGLIAPDLLVFCGNIEKHPSYRRIKDFTAKYGVNILSLCRGNLLDIGSVIPVREVIS